jgi:hypothetical protein
MVCEVIKIGRDCAFMTKKGCSFNGGKCYPVVDRCQGCERRPKNMIRYTFSAM